MRLLETIANEGNMKNRVAIAILAAVAGLAVLAGVGALAYRFGLNHADTGERIVFGNWRTMEGHMGAMNNGLLGWPIGLLVGLLIVGGIVWLILTVAGGAGRNTPPPPPPPGGQWAVTPGATTEGLDRLKELADLHDKKALTDEEFTAAKRKLLGL
jgi:hypothetical protein